MTNKELKTLKDLEWFENQARGFLVDAIDLKAEAVKWRKHMNPDMNVLDFIEEFFNLTEEDLK